MPTEVKSGETLDGTVEGPLIHGSEGGASGTVRVLGVTASGTLETTITNDTIQETVGDAAVNLVVVVGGIDSDGNVQAIPMGTVPTQAMPVTDPNLITIVEDNGTGNASYSGAAISGTTTAQAGWRISKWVDDGTTVTVTLASAGAFDQIWDDRAGLTYS